jgi:glycerol-3-phosphate acyltransferase PlsY
MGGYEMQETIAESILLIVAGYLLGSVSASYVVARLLGGKDLRQYGSGSLGGSMVWEHVGRWAIVPVVLFDIGKGALPTFLGLYLGLGLPVAAVAGMAAVVGHNWSIFLRFTGGRGLGTFEGVLLVLFPWGGLWMAALVIVGYLLGDSAPWFIASLVSMPLLAYLVGSPDVVLPLAVAMLLLTFLKRLEANRRPLPPRGPERRRVILRRLFLDRDITPHQEWIHQQPDMEADASPPIEGEEQQQQ